MSLQELYDNQLPDLKPSFLNRMAAKLSSPFNALGLVLLAPAMLLASTFTTDIDSNFKNDVNNDNVTISTSFNAAAKKEATTVAVKHTLNSSYREALLNMLKDNYGSSYGARGRKSANKHLDIAKLDELERGEISYQEFAKLASGEFGLFPLKDGKKGGVGHHGKTPLSKTAFDQLHKAHLTTTPIIAPTENTTDLAAKKTSSSDKIINNESVFSKFGVLPNLSFDWNEYSNPRDVFETYSFTPHHIYDAPNFTADVCIDDVTTTTLPQAHTAKGYVEEIDYNDTKNIDFEKNLSKIDVASSKIKSVNAIHPVDARTVSKTRTFGLEIHPIRKKNGRHIHCDHTGNDYKYFGPIKASMNGIVVFSGNEGDGYGNKVIVLNLETGIVNLDAHLSKIDVKKGQKIAQGQKIGVTGNTGLAKGIHAHHEKWQTVLTKKGFSAHYLNPQHIITEKNVYPVHERVKHTQHTLSKSTLINKTKIPPDFKQIPKKYLNRINKNNLPIAYNDKILTPDQYIVENPVYEFTGNPINDLIIAGETVGKEAYNEVSGQKSTVIDYYGVQTKLENLTCNQVVQWAKDNKKYVGAGQFKGTTLEDVIKKSGLTGEEKFTPHTQNILISTHVYDHCGFQKVLDAPDIIAQTNKIKSFKRKFMREWTSIGSGRIMPEWQLDDAIRDALELDKLNQLQKFEYTPNFVGPVQMPLPPNQAKISDLHFEFDF